MICGRLAYVSWLEKQSRRMIVADPPCDVLSLYLASECKSAHRLGHPFEINMGEIWWISTNSHRDYRAASHRRAKYPSSYTMHAVLGRFTKQPESCRCLRCGLSHAGGKRLSIGIKRREINTKKAGSIQKRRVHARCFHLPSFKSTSSTCSCRNQMLFSTTADWELLL